jgi:hypothetical protein
MTAFAVSLSRRDTVTLLIFGETFQTGGLLSDVFLHLIPHAFMGEHSGGGVQVVIVEEKRNILIGCVDSLFCQSRC